MSPNGNTSFELIFLLNFEFSGNTLASNVMTKMMMRELLEQIGEKSENEEDPPIM